MLARIKKGKIIFALGIAVVFLLSANLVWAQGNFGLNQAAGFGLPTIGLVDFIGNIIKIILGILGVIAVLLLTFSGVMRWWIAVAVGVLVYSVLEAAFQRRLTVLVLRATLALAAIGAVILAYEFAALLLVGALAALAVLTLADNVQEIRRS